MTLRVWSDSRKDLPQPQMSVWSSCSHHIIWNLPCISRPCDVPRVFWLVVSPRVHQPSRKPNQNTSQVIVFHTNHAETWPHPPYIFLFLLCSLATVIVLRAKKTRPCGEVVGLLLRCAVAALHQFVGHCLLPTLAGPIGTTQRQGVEVEGGAVLQVFTGQW